MKHKHSLFRVIAVTLILSVSMLTLQTDFAEVSPAVFQSHGAEPDQWNDDWLHVEGNKIVDMYGNEVWLTGCNWFGFNCTENMLHGAGWAQVNLRDMVQSIADRGFNLLRIPVSTELLMSWQNGNPKEANFNAWDSKEQPGSNWELVPFGRDSMLLFDAFIRMCKDVGVKVLIDVHSAKSDNAGHIRAVWYDGAITAKEWTDSLVWLADKYKNDDTIIGYDLKNEPHGTKSDDPFAKWDDSADVNNWKHAAETCGQAVLAVNPNALILVEGNEVYPVKGATWDSPVGGWGAPSNFHGAWWGGNLRGVKDYPIEMKSPKTGHSQLVYSPHDYGPTVYNQSWFNKDFTEQTLLDDYWRDSWAYLIPDYPLLMGEWGLKLTTEGGSKKDEQWAVILRDFMEKNGIHHTFWCFNPNSGDTNGLVGTDWITWNEEKYELVDEALWQDESGRHIGLDHKTPLGNGGISLTDYYGDPKPKQGTFSIEAVKISGGDYIKISNISEDTLTARGLYVSDGGESFMWQVPPFIIKSGEFIIVSGTNTDLYPPAHKRTAVELNISAAEKLFLIYADDEVVAKWEKPS